MIKLKLIYICITKVSNSNGVNSNEYVLDDLGFEYGFQTPTE